MNLTKGGLDTSQAGRSVSSGIDFTAALDEVIDREDALPGFEPSTAPVELQVKSVQCLFC